MKDDCRTAPPKPGLLFSVLGLILSSSPYLRLSKGLFPLGSRLETKPDTSRIIIKETTEKQKKPISV